MFWFSGTFTLVKLSSATPTEGSSSWVGALAGGGAVGYGSAGNPILCWGAGLVGMGAYGIGIPGKPGMVDGYGASGAAG